MDDKLGRRDFLGAAGLLTPLVQSVLTAQSVGSNVPDKTTPYRKVVIEPFDYTGVTLGQSFWQRQASSGRDYYLSL
jgi:hypothetical protein